MTAGRSRARAAADAGLVALFAGLLCLPALRNLTGPRPAPVGTENRPMAPRPEWRWKRAYLLAFPAKFEAFYNDRFGFRDTLIHWLSLAKLRWLHTSASTNVVVGRNGWLFYTLATAGKDYENARPFTEEELAGWGNVLLHRRDWLAARGIRYYFVVAPDKQSIYPEMLPASLRRRQGPSRLDQLQAYLRAHSDFRILDLREPLRRARDSERLYAVTDSHWNDRGAYVAYCRLLDVLAPAFPVLRPLPRTAFEEVTVRAAGGDLARMLGLEDRFREEHLRLIPRRPPRARYVAADPSYRLPLPPLMLPFAMERPEPALPRAVMFRDSFATNLIPFLSEHFRRIFYLWQELDEFNYGLVEREKPDLVIQEIAERKLSLEKK